jgi:hypothetical protein
MVEPANESLIGLKMWQFSIERNLEDFNSNCLQQEKCYRG